MCARFVLWIPILTDKHFEESVFLSLFAIVQPQKECRDRCKVQVLGPKSYVPLCVCVFVSALFNEGLVYDSIRVSLM